MLILFILCTFVNKILKYYLNMGKYTICWNTLFSLLTKAGSIVSFCLARYSV
jgi:hypothetical protein